jgi:predicted nucleic acid-binding protein
MIVADVNLSVYLYVEGPHTPEVREVLQRDPEWVVPSLWQSEFLNMMWQYIRQDTFAVEDALRRFNAAKEMVRIEDPPPPELVLRLAADHNGLRCYIRGLGTTPRRAAPYLRQRRTCSWLGCSSA